jgi:lipopolysaccharide export LptBFGC system permease protein LptF
VCIGGWASALVILQIGAQQLRPEVAAWLPVVLYLPLTVWLLQRIKT